MDKAVKGATKPKHQAPKGKYIDAIVSTTFSADGTFHDVCRALAARLRDSNSTVVFKALIVVHTLVRAGNQEKVLGFLSGTKMLGLETVVSGFDTAQNLTKYASYLDRRIRTYGAIKYDIIRDKSERRGERDGIRGCNRLRHLTVEKGLLRETTLLQKEMDSLADCKFYLDDMDDDITMTALRLLVKDLLMIFQAVNEGVISVLEHYFEMSKTDAATALKIYKRFCLQTENVVSYLAIAKKLQNIINVPIPNLKHAPVSLAGSLEEYLNDPNFEQNRKEYKENSRIADGRPASKSPAPPKTTSPAPQSQSQVAPSTPPSQKNEAPKKSFTDFFSSIEAEQPNMFNPQTGSPTQHYFQQQASYNPFMNRPVSMMNFGGMQSQQTGFGGMQPQQTGFGAGMQPQQTGFGNQQNGFGGMQPQATGFAGMQPQPQPQQPQQSAFLQPQMTGFAPGGMLQPQATGSNPFRQSMVMPQATGFAGGPIQPQATGNNPFLSVSAPQQQPQQRLLPQNTAFRPQSMLFSVPESGTTGAPAPSASPFQRSSGGIPPSSSAPSLNVPDQSTSPKPLSAQPTGSRNPFAPPPEEQERIAKEQQAQQAKQQQAAVPSMNQMALDAFMKGQQQQQEQQKHMMQQQQQQQLQQQPQQTAQQPTPLQSQATGGGGLFANVASSFSAQGTSSSNGTPTGAPSSSFNSSSSPAPAPLASQSTGFPGLKPFQPSSSFGQAISSGQSGDGLSAQATGMPGASSSPAPLSAQPTGFGGSSVKPFQPSSSFGASLAQNLPSIPSQATGAGSSQFGSSLSPNMTGTSNSSGAANPFRASMLSSTPTGTASTAGTSLFSQPTGMPQQQQQPSQKDESWESKFSSTFGSFGTGFGSNTNNHQNQQESLI